MDQPNDIQIFRYKIVSRRGQIAAWVAVCVVLVGFIAYSIVHQDRWMFVCATLFSAVAVAGARAGWHDWKRMQRCGLEIDQAGARAVFRHFEFLPQPKDWTPDAPYIVPFDEVIAAHLAYARYGPACLTLKTTLGTVAILARLEGFETVASLFQGVARKNETRLTQSGAKRPAPPEIPTPWYGWIILAAAITTIAATAWFVIFRKS